MIKFARSVFNLLIQLFWVSAGRLLLGVHVVIIIMAGIDLCRFWWLDLRLKDSIETALTNPQVDLTLLLLLSLMFFLPILITVSKYRFTETLDARLKETSFGLRRFSLYSHFLLFWVLVFFWFLIPYMEQLSGVDGVRADGKAFWSIFIYVLLFFNSVFLLLLLGNIVKSIWDTKQSKDLREYLQSFNKWLTYTYPRSLIYPVYGRDKLNFNAGGISPEIKGINDKIAAYLKRYQLMVPGSRTSKNYLKKLFIECSELVFGLLGIDAKKFRFELYTGTSRAIEVAISRASKPTVVILSPHEHFSEAEVSNWLASQHQTTKSLVVNQIKFTPIQHELTVEEQLILMRELTELSIKAQLEKDKNNLTSKKGVRGVDGNSRSQSHFIFVISEVSSVTGLVLEISSICEELMKSSEVKRLRDVGRFQY